MYTLKPKGCYCVHVINGIIIIIKNTNWSLHIHFYIQANYLQSAYDFVSFHLTVL